MAISAPGPSVRAALAKLARGFAPWTHPARGAQEDGVSGKRGSERRVMAGAILVRLDAELAIRVANAADDADLSAAAFLRRLAVGATRSAPELARPTSPRQPVPPPPPEAVREVARLREVVGELAGALVRAAILVRADGAAVLHAEIEAILPDVRAVARELDRMKLALLIGTRPS